MSKHASPSRHRGRRLALLLIPTLLLALGLTALVWYLAGRSSVPGPVSEDPGTPTLPAVTAAPTAGPTEPLTTAPPSIAPEAASALDSSLTARSILLYDATNDRVLYARAAEEILHPASLTKLMTAAVAVKYATGESYTVGREVYLKDSQASSAYLKIGDVLTLEQMLQAMLLPSGADAAYCLAVTTVRRLYPQEELSNFEAAMRFVDLMNETAREIGAENTFFENPDGIDHTNHLSTAEDMRKVFAYALSFPQIRETVGTANVTFTPEKGGQMSFVNTNRLLNRSTPWYYPACIGGKTGSTGQAGYCLAAAAEKNGVTLMALVFGCREENTRFSEAAALFNAGFTAMGIN